MLSCVVELVEVKCKIKEVISLSHPTGCDVAHTHVGRAVVRCPFDVAPSGMGTLDHPHLGAGWLCGTVLS